MLATKCFLRHFSVYEWQETIRHLKKIELCRGTVAYILGRFFETDKQYGLVQTYSRLNLSRIGRCVLKHIHRLCDPKGSRTCEKGIASSSELVAQLHIMRNYVEGYAI